MRYFFIVIIMSLATTAMGQPDASFSLSKWKVCSGTKVVFTNTSTGGTSYSWFVNDIFYSNNVHDSVILVEPCYDLQPIKLVAYNNSGSDTQTHVVEVFDTCAMHLNGDYTNCVGDTIRLNVHPEAISHVWDITPSHTLLTGCDTCDSISFILNVIGTTVDLLSTYEGGCSQPVSYHYYMCNPLTETGIEDLYTDKIKIYPNPADDLITIENKTGENITTIQLYNIHGSQLTIQRPSTSSIDVSQLAAGIYFLRVDIPGGTIIKKFLKE